MRGMEAILSIRRPWRLFHRANAGSAPPPKLKTMLENTQSKQKFEEILLVYFSFFTYKICPSLYTKKITIFSSEENTFVN